jgi:hypothetical protein
MEVTAEMVATVEMAGMVGMVAMVTGMAGNRWTPMIPKGLLCLIVGAGASFGQGTPRIAPVPGDPLELVAGHTPAAETAATRDAALQLIARARTNYSLRSDGQGYDLKVTFAVDSQGQTDLDGAWDLEDIYVPVQGLHWTAHAAAGYSITGVASHGELYNEGTERAVPLRLEEVRGILLHPLPSDAYASRESIRTSAATLNGALVTCVLLSTSKKSAGKPAAPVLGRAWEESEECIDPQSGLLLMHSEAPGRYVVYDYSNAPQLGSHQLPRTVTVTEGGRVVSKITVASLEEINGTDPGLFVASDQMKARGRSVEMAPMTKISRVHGQAGAGTTVRPVCVFGLVNAAGQLVEAHSLQPSDPNSHAAVEDAKQIDFTPKTPSGSAPQQHFVFVIEKFISR